LTGDTIKNKAKGFHATAPERLADYDINLRKPREKKPTPTAVIVPEIKDDIDGQGFIVSTQVDPYADNYEWQKGAGTDPSDIKTIPPMTHYKITSKASFIDNEVAKG
jgi:hypothetical protein